MAVTTFLTGPTGTGKSFSMKEMDPATTLWIRVVRKPESFRSNGAWKEIDDEGNGNVFISDDFETIKMIMSRAKGKGFNKIFIDDANYTLVNEFMRRSGERGFDKFTEMAFHVWDLVKFASESIDNDVRVYFTWHTILDNMGNVKMKFQGKLLEEQVSLEGMLTLILESVKEDGKYFFRTQNDGAGVAKTPYEMFDAQLIPNDLASVDAAIVDYYQL